MVSTSKATRSRRLPSPAVARLDCSPALETCSPLRLVGRSDFHGPPAIVTAHDCRPDGAGSRKPCLDKPLRAVVTLLAKRLERAEPEFIDVAVMRLNVIADRRRCDDAALCAILTQRVLEQLVPSDSSPASRGVPLIPLCLPAANTHRSTYHPPPHVPSTALCRKVQCRTDGRTHPDTTHAWRARCSRLIAAGKANTGNVIYKSFSASSRNSSGTDRATDPYPTASPSETIADHVNSAAAVQRAIPLWCRAGVFHLQAPAEVPAALSRASQDATRRSPAAIWSSPQGDRRALYERAPRRFRQG